MPRRPKSIQELRQIQRDIHELSQPFVRAKCDILAVSLPTYRLYPDGRFETIYSTETVQALARIDDLWKQARMSYLARKN